MRLRLKKTSSGLTPYDEIGAEALEKYRDGSLLLCDIVQPRNPGFHRKFFALLNVGFKYWDPGEVSSHFGKPQKNFDVFREQVTILAGFYEMVIDMHGNARAVAKSVSFANMSEDDFAELYSKVIDVLLARIFVGYTDQQVIKMAEDELIGFS